MSDRLGNDDLIERLRAEDPAAEGVNPELPGERESVRSRARDLLESESRTYSRPILRPRFVFAGVLVLLAVGIGLALSLGSSSSGPARALAIERSSKWVTLRLTNPNASDDQMNQELADAGIDRVRVLSVPGDPKSVGTWAGYLEFGPHCLGGVTRYGYDVDIPISHPYNRANRHGAENLFDLTLPRHPGGGALTAQEVGDPYSKSVVRLPTDSIDNPRNAAKILVPVRPRSPDDTAATNDIGTDQLIALGGVFAQYGEAIQSGHTSCRDLGLKPFSATPFPPSDQGWVVLDVTSRRGGARQMTRELRSGGIKGRVRQIPTRRDQVGHYVGLVRVPPLLGSNPIGMGSGAYNGADIVSNSYAHGPAKYDIALRLSAFDAHPDARWILYVGRPVRSGETAKLVGPEGPESERAAVRSGCKGLVHELSKHGPKGCVSFPRISLPTR